MIIGLFMLIEEQFFYEKKKFANFKGVAEDIADWDTKYSSNEVLVLVKSNNSAYMNHYLSKKDREIGSQNVFEIQTFQQASQLVDEHNGKYILIAFANGGTTNELHEYVKQSYPTIKEHNRYFNSDAILYSKEPNERGVSFSSSFKGGENKNWEVSPMQLQDSVYRIHPPAFILNEQLEYALTFRDTLENLLTEKEKYLTISAWIRSAKNNNFQLVISVSDQGKQIEWSSVNSIDYWKADEWFQLVHVFEKKESIPLNAEIAIYFWNNEKKKAVIDDFRLDNFYDSDYNYYEFRR